MGMGATDIIGRVLASLGKITQTDVKFGSHVDLPCGGVLLSLPALLLNGLLQHTEKYFQLPKGFYRLDSIFILLSFMALCRFRSIEQFRYKPPGEWGKIIGLDRAPEVKTIRDKISELTKTDAVKEWSEQLCRDWMEANPQDASILYVDGHVRVYNGNQTKLPKHYVARQKLCLRATTDYWVNAMDGQPFFFVNKPVDPGLLKVLEDDIVPRLISEVPGQPPPIELKADPYLKRFTIVFDREGYSPEFFLKMKSQNIACLSYHKYPGENWPAEEFMEYTSRLSGGEKVEMLLAERGTYLGDKVWVREIRKLTKSGHQTSVIASDYRANIWQIAVHMFARWSQENFFKYMRQNFNIDGLIDYSIEPIDDATLVINPQHRALDSKIRSLVSKVSRKKAEFGSLTIQGEIQVNKIKAYEQKKSQLHEEIDGLTKEIDLLKNERKQIPKRIKISELPEDQRFDKLTENSKHFIDTIKMIAYRAETAMVNVLRQSMSRHDDGRNLLKNLYTADADITPNFDQKTLTIRLHHLANAAEARSAAHLCSELTETNTIFPGTDLRMIFQLISPVTS